MPASHLVVYLAGPISNCNEKQKLGWRKTIKSQLDQLGHTHIDPTEHTQNWSPFEEMVEIDTSDVVIANIWKESIGTVVGIIQALRRGKPVILIDSNYLDSSVLKTFVGENFIVRGLDQAIHKLQKDIVPSLASNVAVRKRDGSLQGFTFAKLRRSLITVCARVQINDAVLPDLVASGVRDRIRQIAKDGEVRTDQIEKLVFEQFDLLISSTDKLYGEDLNEQAVRMKAEWELQHWRKNDELALDELGSTLDEHLSKISLLEGRNAELTSERALLLREIRKCERQLKEGHKSPDGNNAGWFVDPDSLEKAYANYFPNLVFQQQVLDWLLDDSVTRLNFERKFSLMNQGQTDGKHEVPETAPLVWQHDAGNGLKIYFRRESNGKTMVLRVGTKGTQPNDYKRLQKGFGTNLGRRTQSAGD